MATAAALTTFAELDRLPEADGFRYELRRGELVKLAPQEHEYFLIRRRLRRLLEAAAGALGELEINIPFRALPEHEYREADVALVSKERWERIPLNGNLAGAPELVIQVLSPSNTASEIFDKELLCLENGSLEFWVVDPVRKQVRVSSAGGHTVTWKAGQEIPLLFGGVLAVDTIFD